MLHRHGHRSVRAQALHYLARPHAAVPRAPVVGPAAWRADELTDEEAWTYQLSAADLDEIGAALRAAPAELARVRAASFPLPSLAPRIRAWRDTINHGRGFVRIRGVPVDRWPESDVERFFWGLGQHLGRPGAQNGQGELLGHVRDLRTGRDGHVRQYMTSEAISYHCDAADAVGLLCVHTARSGGLSRIASSVSIFNRVLDQRPDLAPRLFEPMYFDARGDGGTDAFRARPCAFHDGRLRTFYHAEYLRTAERHPGVPALSPAHHQLLDLYDRLAGSPELCLEMELRPGDIQLVSNHTIVHARSAYTDHDDPAQRRHLLRLWLSLETPGRPGERLRRARALAELVAGLARRKLEVRSRR